MADDLVSAALRTIDQCYWDADFSIHAADKLSVSHSHLDHLIEHATGLTFRRHLRWRRAAAAARFLRSTQLPLYDIPHAVGYKDYATLVRHFKAEYRCSPAEYRRRIKQARWLDHPFASADRPSFIAPPRGDAQDEGPCAATFLHSARKH